MTTKRNKADPKGQARELLSRFAITKWPIDVGKIAAALKIAVREIDLDDNLSGMIFFQEHTVIAINSRHHINRKRFTLAHEIGHFVLHSKELSGDVHVDKKFLTLARDPNSSGGFDPKEIEANSFAAELLVPRHMLLHAIGSRVIDAEDEIIIRDLAKKFAVSEQMMSFRIADLVSNQFNRNP